MSLPLQPVRVPVPPSSPVTTLFLRPKFEITAREGALEVRVEAAPALWEVLPGRPLVRA